MGGKTALDPAGVHEQKVHSGVIVHSEGDRVRIEGIDLEGGEWKSPGNS